jgi:hypothetical protein
MAGQEVLQKGRQAPAGSSNPQERTDSLDMLFACMMMPTSSTDTMNDASETVFTSIHSPRSSPQENLRSVPSFSSRSHGSSEP